MKPVHVTPREKLRELTAAELVDLQLCPFRYFKQHLQAKPSALSRDGGYSNAVLAWRVIRSVCWSIQQTGQNPNDETTRAATIELIDEFMEMAHPPEDLVESISELAFGFIAKLVDYLDEGWAIKTAFQLHQVRFDVQADPWTIKSVVPLVLERGGVLMAVYIDPMGVLDGLHSVQVADHPLVMTTFLLARENIGPVTLIEAWRPDPCEPRGSIADTALAMSPDESDITRVVDTLVGLRENLRAFLAIPRWYPNRLAPTCRRRACPAWSACQREWGGCVRP